MAAWAIARTAQRPGDVALIVGSHRYLGDKLREIGFRSYFRENAPASFHHCCALILSATRLLVRRHR